MDYNRIAFLLKKEIEHQGKLHDVLQREKQAIMTFESEQIEKIAEEKKVFLEQSSATQKKLAKELTPEEVERRALGAERLKEAFSSIPWHAQKAAKNPEYWNNLYGSRVNW